MNAGIAYKYYRVSNICCIQLSSINNTFIIIYSYYCNIINIIQYNFFDIGCIRILSDNFDKILLT